MVIISSVWFWMAMGFSSGSVMYSYLLPKNIKGIDIRKLSKDGNPGTANAVKHAGVFIGLMCLALDMLKGFIPVVFALKHLSLNTPLFFLVLASPVLGHAFSPMFGFHGGKAIATSFGVLLALLPSVQSVYLLTILYLLYVFFKVKPNELCTFLTFFSFAIINSFLPFPINVRLGCGIIALIVIFKNGREALSGFLQKKNKSTPSQEEAHEVPKETQSERDRE